MTASTLPSGIEGSRSRQLPHSIRHSMPYGGLGCQFFTGGLVPAGEAQLGGLLVIEAGNAVPDSGS